MLQLIIMKAWVYCSYLSASVPNFILFVLLLSDAKHHLELQFSAKVCFTHPNRGHLTMSGRIFSCQSGVEGFANGI